MGKKKKGRDSGAEENLNFSECACHVTTLMLRCPGPNFPQLALVSTSQAEPICVLKCLMLFTFVEKARHGESPITLFCFWTNYWGSVFP